MADPQPLTLAEIVAALRAGEGRRPGLLPVPPALIALAAQAIGRGEEWQRLGGSLVADPAKLLERRMEAHDRHARGPRRAHARGATQAARAVGRFPPLLSTMPAATPTPIT